MARDYDAQLLESVGVRRRRLRDAVLFGTLRTRRSANDNMRRAFSGLALSAVLCAGCVGWSFLQHQLAKQQNQQNQRGNPSQLIVPVPSTAATVPSTAASTAAPPAPSAAPPAPSASAPQLAPSASR